MKIIALTALLLVSSPAHAGWFSGDCHAKSQAELNSFAMHRYIYQSQDYWRSLSGVTINSDNVIRGKVSKADIDRYAAYVQLVREQVAQLKEECLRAAYTNTLDGEADVIERSRRALEFLKTPNPIPSGS